MSSVSSGFVGEIDLPDADHVAIGPDGKFALVCRPTAMKVAVIDTSDGRIVKELGVDRRANQSVFSRDSLFAYVVMGSDSVLEFSTDDWSLKRRIDLSPRPVSMKMSNNATFAYTTFFGGFQEINLEVPSIERTYAINTISASFSMSLDGERAFFTDRESLIVFDLLGFVVKFAIPIDNADFVAVDSTGSRAYVWSNRVGENRVQVVDIGRLEVIHEIPVLAFVKGVALTSCGAHAFVLSSRGSVMKVINTDSYAEIGEAFVGGELRSLVVTPDDSRVYVANGSAVKVFDTSQWKL